MEFELTDLVGGADIADMAGVKPQVVANWRNRYDDFPLPVVAVARNTVPLFSRQQVVEWLIANNRLQPKLKCVNCRDTFTLEEAVVHARPRECVEWGNHQMSEVNYVLVFDI